MSQLGFIDKEPISAPNDECYTPPEAILPLLDHLDKSKVWYEATSSKSKSIIGCMQAAGFKCVDSQNKDFFECTAADVYDGIITNPPYSLKDEFLRHCYSLSKPFALLMPVAAIAGIARGSLYKQHGIKLFVLSKRIDFTGKGRPQFSVAWFCHQILKESLIFHCES